jgi:hypothetical protein
MLELILQLIHLPLRLGKFINLRQITVFLHQLARRLFTMGFNILLGFILAVIDLFNLVLQFLDQTIDMPLRVGLVGADSV